MSSALLLACCFLLIPCRSDREIHGVGQWEVLIDLIGANVFRQSHNKWPYVVDIIVNIQLPSRDCLGPHPMDTFKRNIRTFKTHWTGWITEISASKIWHQWSLKPLVLIIFNREQKLCSLNLVIIDEISILFNIILYFILCSFEIGRNVWRLWTQESSNGSTNIVFILQL